MKRYLCASLALAVVGNAAHAQTSVTVFGLIDASLRSIETGPNKLVTMGSDGMLNSRLGFRAEEDLGGGYKAGAWLETAFNPDDGTLNASGKFWHRRSTVSLYTPYGELRLGRDLNPTFYNLSIFDPFNTCGVGSGFNLVTNLGSPAKTLLRTDNAVAFILPQHLGGLYGHFMVAPGEGVPGNQYAGARIGYQAGPFNTAVAFANTGTGTQANFKELNAGASYDAKFAKFMVLYNQVKYGALKQVSVELGITAPVGQSGLIRASYQRANASGPSIDANDASQIAVGYVLELSKRTSLYTTYSNLANKGAARYVIGTQPAAVPGGTSRGFEAGMMHTF